MEDTLPVCSCDHPEPIEVDEETIACLICGKILTAETSGYIRPRF